MSDNLFSRETEVKSLVIFPPTHKGSRPWSPGSKKYRKCLNLLLSSSWKVRKKWKIYYIKYLRILSSHFMKNVHIFRAGTKTDLRLLHDINNTVTVTQCGSTQKPRGCKHDLTCVCRKKERNNVWRACWTLRRHHSLQNTDLILAIFRYLSL